MAGEPTITQPTLEVLIERFKCGGLDLHDAVNLIGRLVSTLYNEAAGKIVISVGGSSFIIPEYDSIEFTYVALGVADDDLIATQVFKNGVTTVATLTFAYVGATNNIESITLS